ncbi:hypothetical protein LCGC14_2098940 [marine sediment metagenome]|uniref:Uncharacterized protein n=1 Tax=marine sediment metagenome TaxID=412755 RepID=A0A0F9H6Y0_9ZZZZ
MILESKPLSATVLKETYVLLAEVNTLWLCFRLYYASDEDMPEHLLEMLEKRIENVLMDVSDLLHPFPF